MIDELNKLPFTKEWSPQTSITLEQILSNLHNNAVSVEFTDTIPTKVPAGKLVFFDDGSLFRLYWQSGDGTVRYCGAADGGSGGGSGSVSNYYTTGLVDADADTKIQVEESADEDIIRFDTGDTAGGATGERATIDYNGLHLTSGLRLGLEGRTGDVYVKWNSGTSFMEFYVDGAIRMEM